MFTDNPGGMLLHAKKRSLLPSDEVELHLLDIDGSDLGPMTLTSAHSFIKPFTYLGQAQRSSKGNYFKIKPLKIFDPELPPKRHRQLKGFKRSGHGKEFHLTTETTTAYLKHVLNKSCEYLIQGARLQFNLHQPHRNGKKGKPIDHAMEYRPQLRPDTILRAMPEGTTMLAYPCIAPKAMTKVEIREGVDPPLLWVLEHKPSLKRLDLSTPGWIKEMATWNVELKADPKFDKRQPVKTMWNYSKAATRASHRTPRVSDTSKPPTNHPAAHWRTTTLDELVP